MGEGDISEKIRTARKFHRPALTQDELAARANLSRAMIGSMESGRRAPTATTISRIADSLRIPIDWFYDGRPGPPPLPPDVITNSPGLMVAPPAPSIMANWQAEASVGRRKFPLLGAAGASSFPQPSDIPWPGDFVEFSDDLFREDRFAIQVRGDSMSPRIEHGDYVLVQPDPDPHIGILTVAKNDDHEYVVKVARRGAIGIELQPINLDYLPIIPGDGWKTVGYAVGRRQERGKGRYLEEGDNAGLRP